MIPSPNFFCSSQFCFKAGKNYVSSSYGVLLGGGHKFTCSVVHCILVMFSRLPKS